MPEYSGQKCLPTEIIQPTKAEITRVKYIRAEMWLLFFVKIVQLSLAESIRANITGQKCVISQRLNFEMDISLKAQQFNTSAFPTFKFLYKIFENQNYKLITLQLIKFPRSILKTNLPDCGRIQRTILSPSQGLWGRAFPWDVSILGVGFLQGLDDSLSIIVNM